VSAYGIRIRSDVQNPWKSRVAILSPNVMGLIQGINRAQPGLGMMYLGAVLESRGHEVFLRDCAAEGYERQIPLDDRMMVIGESDDQIEAYLRDVRPEFVGITILFSNLAPQAHRIAALSKKMLPAVPVIIGGNHVSAKAEEMMQADAHIDFAMAKECDFTFATFIERLKSGGDFKSVPGAIYREGARIVRNRTAAIVSRMDDLPFPARHLMNMEKYFRIGKFHNPFSKHPRVANVMCSRGCPEKCTFCTTPEMWGSTIRWRSPRNVADEIKHLIDDYGVGEIQFEDDTLTLNRVKLLELCDLIEPFHIKWNTVNGIKVNYHSSDPAVQDHMFQRMADAGCYQVCLAIESGNQELLDTLVRKNLNLSVVPQTIAAAKKAGIQVHSFFMVGFPGETVEDMESTVAYAEGLDLDSYSLSLYNPLPGTPLFDHAKRNGHLVDDFREDRILYAKSNIKIPGVAPEEVERLVSEWNKRLNGKALTKNPRGFEEHYGRFLRENDVSIFQKNS